MSGVLNLMMYMDIKLAAGVLTLSVSLYRCEKCLQFLHGFSFKTTAFYFGLHFGMP